MQDFSRASKQRREAATLRNLDPLKHISQYPDSQGEHVVSPIDPSSLTSTPVIQRRLNGMNKTLRNFPGLNLDNTPIKYGDIPKTSA